MQIGIITDKNGNPAGGGGGFTTVYDVDFSTLPNQTFSGASATIDGKVWTITGAAAGGIVNGSGLVVSIPTDSVSRSIGLALSTIGTGFKRRVRISTHMTYSGSVNGSSNESYAVFGLWRDGMTGLTTLSSNRINVGFHNHGYGPTGLFHIAQAYADTSGTNNESSAANVDTAHLIELSAPNYWQMSGAYASGFPNPGDMRNRAAGTNWSFGNDLIIHDIAIGLFMFNNGNACTLTLSRLLVETSD